jgi:glycyl-tRNA synthetase
MAEPKENPLMEKIVSLCKRRGFIYQSSEIYGGINGFWDYGPLGAELKRNVKELWWREMVQLRDDVVGLEATIIMHRSVWKASGHEDTFADPMSTCKHCKKLIRSDQWWTIMCEQQWVQSLAALVSPESNAFRGEDLLKWAKGKGKQLAPNLALVRNPEVTLSWLSQDIENGKRPADAREFYLYLATEQLGATGLITPCPHCGGELTAPRPFNLMLQTHYGPIASEENLAYLRPETAQAIFVQFKNVLDSSRQKVPFGIAQMGKAFRNEITPRNYTFRSREFEQMELEFFIRPDEAIEALHGSVGRVPGEGHPGEPQPNWGWQAWHRYWVEERVRFYEGIGLSRDTLGFHVQAPAELAHYARATVDILYKFPFSKEENGEVKGDELEGIAARGDFDLGQHEKFSGKPLTVFDEEVRGAWTKLPEEKKTELRGNFTEAKTGVNINKKKMDPAAAAATAHKEAEVFFDRLAKGQYLPHVIEPSAGVDRLILALICNAYSEINDPDEKGKSDTRVIMRFHPRVAPIKVAVLPLLKNKPDLVAKAHSIFENVRRHMMAFYDDAGSIGRRYARQDEAGTPFCVTVDFETLEGIKEGPLAGEKDTVTIRYRGDTDEENGRQERVRIPELLPLLLEKIR